MTSEHHTQIEENRCFRVIFGALGSLGGPLGGSGGPFGPKSVFRTGEHGSLDPLWAPLADPKIDRKSLKLIHVGIFCPKKFVPKQVHKQDHFVSKFCAILVTPEPCFLTLARTGARFSKNGLITKSCKQTSKSWTKWKPKASNAESKDQPIAILW